MDRRVFERGLLVLSVLAVLGMIAYVAWIGRAVAADAAIGFHGVVAMLLGVFLTLSVTALLVGLLLYSRRHGYDQGWELGSQTRPDDGDG